MKQLISIREANQHLSRYIDAVQNGDEIIITRRGLPVAKLAAYAKSLELSDTQKAARQRSRARMRKGYSIGGQMPVRETLHERKAINAVNAHTLSFWDAMLWAVAREAGVTLLLSDDFQHDRILDGIRFCNPFKLDRPIDYIFKDNQSL
jgi:prevent-host-death family protein